MVRKTVPVAVWVALALAAPAAAQDAPARPPLAEVRFGDGSLVRMTILQESLDVLTKYGKLTVPIADIRRVEFGLHVPTEVHHQINQSIKLLASDLYKEREGATKDLLQVGHWAYPSLRKASRSADQEVANRAATLLRQLSDRVGPDALRAKEEDIIHTTEFPVIGRIVSPTIKAHSAHFGDLALKLPDLRAMHLRHHGGTTEVVLDAAKYGSAPDQWLDTGVVVDPTLRLAVHADGQVDLWPQGPGQYLAAPKGYNTAGKGGAFMAGALVGRIGEQGKAFLIGDHYEGTPTDEGRLYLHVIPSPWNNASTGSYRVRIQTDHAALTAR